MRSRSAGVLALWLTLGPAAAAPLDKEACEVLKAEQARLATEALKADMEKGPEWAKANLAPARLKEIQAFIELEEQLTFRCPNPAFKLPRTTTAAKPPDAKKADRAPGELETAPVVPAPGSVPDAPASKKAKPAAKKKPAATKPKSAGTAASDRASGAPELRAE